MTILWFLWAGRGTMHTAAGAVPLAPGTCVWMRPGWTYDVEQTPADPLGLDFIYFALTDRAGQPLPPDLRLPPEHLLPVDAIATGAIVRHIVELLWCGRADNLRIPAPRLTHDPWRWLPAMEVDKRDDDVQRVADFLLTGLLMELTVANRDPERATFDATRQHHIQVARQTALALQESGPEQPSIAELARKVGYGPDHLARIFRDVIGCTPVQFAVEQRLNQARQMLAQDGFTVKQTAAALGYRDVPYFCRQFRQKTGLTPSQWQRGQAPATSGESQS